MDSLSWFFVFGRTNRSYASSRLRCSRGSPNFYPVFLALLFQVFPVEVQIVVAPPGVVAESDLAWLLLEIAVLPSEVVAESAVAGLLGIGVAILVVWLLLDILVLPSGVVVENAVAGPREIAVATVAVWLPLEMVV
ncbi:MAG: hypothetical protein WCW53_07940 [Syntrophales bacterium]